jgi:hypothetical protein
MRREPGRQPFGADLQCVQLYCGTNSDAYIDVDANIGHWSVCLCERILGSSDRRLAFWYGSRSRLPERC